MAVSRDRRRRPRRFPDIVDLAVARGFDPAKYTQGLGVRELAVRRAR